jgi:hypothetical protein
VVETETAVLPADCGAGEQAATNATPADAVSQPSAWRLVIIMNRLPPPCS